MKVREEDSKLIPRNFDSNITGAVDYFFLSLLQRGLYQIYIYIYSPWFEGTLAMAEHPWFLTTSGQFNEQALSSRPNEIIHAKSL